MYKLNILNTATFMDNVYIETALATLFGIF